MTCLKRCALGLLVALLLLAGTAALLLRQAPAWLAAADAPEKADAIIVLGSRCSSWRSSSATSSASASPDAAGSGGGPGRRYRGVQGPRSTTPVSSSAARLSLM
jgi:hypothetical protein